MHLNSALRHTLTILILLSGTSLRGQTGAPALSGEQIVDRVSPSAVVILAGPGDGQVASFGSGLIIRSDGVILTAYHVVQGMREVQVRLKNGEVYDQVELLAVDERRDAAALRIPAAGLPVLPLASAAGAAAGSSVFAVASAAGLPWTATSGILSAMRLADEVPGAGSGFRLLQFTAPLSPGSSGGVLVDDQAHALGIVLGSLSAGQNVNFAVPVESIAGLANASAGTPYALGNRLDLPQPGMPAASASRSAPAAPPAPPAAPSLPRPEQLQLRTMNVQSKTIYLRRERLQDDLRKTALFQQLGVRFADYGEQADITVTVDRPVMTFSWTYTLVDDPTGITLASGMIEGVDEFDAGPKLAAEIIEQFAAAAVLPRAALTGARSVAPVSADASASPVTAADVLQNFKTIYVESHTIWMKGNLLQDALFVRPEISQWGIRIVNDRPSAEIYVDVTRPFLTYNWNFKMVNTRTGTVLRTGKVTAIDGPAAAQRLALEIVGMIRAVRPLEAP